jgi:hypothetical protein
MKESHQLRLELSLLYGRDGLGVVTSNTAGVLAITPATWSTGIWAAGMKGSELEAFDSSAATAVQHNATLTVGAINLAAKTVTVTGTSAAVVAGDVLYFRGSRTATAYNEGPGLSRILSTQAGVNFGIDASVYELWRAQTYAVGGNLSLTAIFNAAAIGMSFGLEKGILLCSPAKFAQLASDEAALRRYVQDTAKVKRGVKSISFMLGNVDIEIVPHPYMKDGIAMLLSEDTIHRVGSTDITFSLPGSQEKMQVHIQDGTGIEIRSFSDQALFSDAPAQSILLTGIA